uniref:Uncharacterized protein n=1 Tax=Arundo donax TaxID=35708 RepID=A0A0A9BGB6_ARUDO
MLKPEKECVTKDKAVPSEFEFTCDAPSSQENCRSKIESSENASIPSLRPAKQRKGDVLIESSPEKVAAENLCTHRGSTPIPGSTMQSKATPMSY